MATRMERRTQRHRVQMHIAVRWAGRALVALLVLLLMRRYVFTLTTVQGPSMMDTLDSGQVVAVDRTFFALHEPMRGVVAICTFPDTGEKYVKRIIALPGDEVRIEDGVTYVNDMPLTEQYIEYGCHEDFGPYTVPGGQVFVMGDNRANSHDSRNIGAIEQNNLIGRVFAVFYPLKEAHFLPLNG